MRKSEDLCSIAHWSISWAEHRARTELTAMNKQTSKCSAHREVLAQQRRQYSAVQQLRLRHCPADHNLVGQQLRRQQKMIQSDYHWHPPIDQLGYTVGRLPGYIAHQVLVCSCAAGAQDQ